MRLRPREFFGRAPREEREKLIHFIVGQLAKFDCKLDPNPGKVTIRRLNRAEYQNTLRDLLKVDCRPEDLPNHEVGYGFDNTGDVLSLPPMLMERYLAAAEEVVRKAILTDLTPKPQTQKAKAWELEPKDIGSRGSDGKLTNAEVKKKFDSRSPANTCCELQRSSWG